jgi:hypothetical protein
VPAQRRAQRRGDPVIVLDKQYAHRRRPPW